MVKRLAVKAPPLKSLSWSRTVWLAHGVELKDELHSFITIEAYFKLFVDNLPKMSTEEFKGGQTLFDNLIKSKLSDNCFVTEKCYLVHG